MNDTEWLKELKAGDHVLIAKFSLGRTRYVARSVDRVTPTGIIVIGDQRFNSNGWERGGRASPWRDTRDYLCPYDEQKLAKQRIENEVSSMTARLQSISWPSLPHATLKAVCELIKQEDTE